MSPETEPARFKGLLLFCTVAEESYEEIQRIGHQREDFIQSIEYDGYRVPLQYVLVSHLCFGLFSSCHVVDAQKVIEVSESAGSMYEYQRHESNDK